MAAPKAPLLGGAKKEVSLDEAVFAAEIRPHLVHEAVRAELNARRQGTRAAESRGRGEGGAAGPGGRQAPGGRRGPAAGSRGARRGPDVPARARSARRSSRAEAS